MKVIDNENVVMCDVDMTLVIWKKDHKTSGKGKVKVIDPYTGDTLYLYPHNPHIRLLRQYKGRGFTIIVHTNAGVKWAEAVVKTLGLEDTVDYCMTKACKHLDDKEAVNEIIGVRVYLNNDEES